MIDPSKLPPGPWEVEFVADRDNELTSEESNRIADLLRWARSIIEPPKEVREAMERLKVEQRSSAWVAYDAHANRVAMWHDDQQTVADWTLKIFEEVKHG